MSEQDSMMKNISDKRGLTTYKRHIFMCLGPKCCQKEEGEKLWNFLKERLKELNLVDPPHAPVYRSKVGCLRICAKGPIAVVYPEATWYYMLDENKLEKIIQSHLINGQPVKEFMFAQNHEMQKPSPEKL